MEKGPAGRLGWIDLTVEGADEVRDFYAAVVGWAPEPVDMGGYADYNMLDETGTPAAGVCHRKAGNADQPAGWIPYFVVRDLDAALSALTEKGGQLLGEVRSAGGVRYTMAADPRGTPFALWEEQP